MTQDIECAAQLRARRLETIVSAGPLSHLGVALSAVILAATFRTIVPLALLLGWIALTVAMIATRAFAIRAPDPDSFDNDRVRARLKRANASMIGNSLLWAISFVVFATYATGDRAAILAVVATLTFVGTVLMHRAAPLAGLVHLALMSASLAASTFIVGGMDAWPVALAIVPYALVLARATILQDRAYAAAVAGEVLRRENEQTVRLLLDEYETQAQDCLWSIGPRGRLRDVSQRLANFVGRPPEDLEGTRFADLFLEGVHRARLIDLIDKRAPFRDEIVRLEVNGKLRSWRVSARARADGSMTGVLRDVTEALRTEDRVRYMALHDDLTGLANRHSFNDRLQAQLGLAGEHARKVALFYLDLDDFKAINDTHGHGFADRLLYEVAQRLEGEVRDEDMVARLAADEFAIVIESTLGDGMLIERAHRFLAVMREPFSIDGRQITLSSSVGVARCTDEACEAEELMRRADLALFAAKSKGRDQFALFDHTLDRKMQQSRRLERDLREALGADTLRVHYQPVIDLASGRTAGYEALVRWDHPEHGMLPPDEFLGIAEKTGLIVPLGEFVVRQALTELAGWDGDFRIAINLSPSQIRSVDLLPAIADALAHTGFDPRRIEFEITEHVILQADDVATATLNRLRASGVKIALDDFGTGYSSLSYLGRFPFDRIKIDRSFVKDLATESSARAIVTAIVGLARSLGMQTTAEGVEDPEQLEILRELGCDEAQGHLFLEPVAAVELDGARGGVVDYTAARAAIMRRRRGTGRVA